MKQASTGLTLIELAIGMAVTAILLSVAVPSFHRFVENNRITSETNHLMANLHYARHAAITHYAQVVACPSPDLLQCDGSNRWDRGWIVFIDKDENGQPDAPEDILRVVSANDRLIMHSAGRHRVRFQPSGSAYGSNLTIRVCSKSQSIEPRAVIVSNPGRARVSRHVDPESCNLNPDT